MDDCPHTSGGAQCIKIFDDDEDKDIIIPLEYKGGISILPCSEPTDDDVRNLPVYDIIDPTGTWNAKELPSEEFNIQICLESLNIRENRRAIMEKRPPGSLWDAQDIAIWQTRLGYVPARVAGKTLEATTQIVESEENLA